MNAPPKPQTRKQTRQVLVGQDPATAVRIGGDAPVRVQSMTNTDTADIKGTAEQIARLAEAGSELVRLTVNGEDAARSVPRIREELDRMQVRVPLVGDFHYNGHLLLTKYPAMARALDKYRINPGNVGFREKRDRQFSTMIECALLHDRPVRIGVNWGSLDKDLQARMMDENARLAEPQPPDSVLRAAMIESALQSAARAQALGLAPEQIILSCKVSKVQELIVLYRELARRTDLALHLGLTEAGMGSRGIVASTAGLAVLLQEGIGDTIRISLTPEPDGDRRQEVRVAQEILQSLGLRSFAPEVTACPGCGRTTSTVFQELAQDIQGFLHERMPQWRTERVGVETMQVAVMGCVVNGPGESKHANIGISLPGTGEQPAAPVFVDGAQVATLRGPGIARAFTRMVEEYVDTHYQPRDPDSGQPGEESRA